MQCAWAILSSLGCPTLQYFFHIISKTVRFSRKDIKHENCVLIFSTSVWNILTLRRSEQDMIKMYNALHVKYLLFLSDCKETWIFSTCFFLKTIKHQISWNSIQWEPTSIRTDGRTGRQTDTTILIVAFRYFANAYKNDRNDPGILKYLLAKWLVNLNNRHTQTCYFLSLKNLMTRKVI
jgi:hypothetical protein